MGGGARQTGGAGGPALGQQRHDPGAQEIAVESRIRIGWVIEPAQAPRPGQVQELGPGMAEQGPQQVGLSQVRDLRHGRQALDPAAPQQG